VSSDIPEPRARAGVPAIFWFSLSLALLAVALSAAYFLLVYFPQRNAARDRALAESLRRETESKAVLDCANQAARALKKFIEEGRMASRVLGQPLLAIGSTNHYNRRLSRCFVDIETADENMLSGFTVLDAYEGAEMLWCIGKIGGQTACHDADQNSIDESQARAREKSLMTE
jgi:hypothetical protein